MPRIGYLPRISDRSILGIKEELHINFEENQVPEAILDKLTKVCTCRSITRKTIKEAILDGAHTFPQVKEVTRAGTGACGGKGCGPRIVKLLAEMKEQGKI